MTTFAAAETITRNDMVALRLGTHAPAVPCLVKRVYPFHVNATYVTLEAVRCDNDAEVEVTFLAEHLVERYQPTPMREGIIEHLPYMRQGEQLNVVYYRQQFWA